LKKHRLSLLFLFAMVVMIAGIVLSGCTSLRSPAGKGDYYLFPFENDLEGWATKSADLGKPPVEWSINRSGEMIKGGKSAAILTLASSGGQPSIWLEKSFPLNPGQRYQVKVTYDFASADSENTWRLITGVAQSQFSNSQDLVFQGDTANGAGSSAGFQWQQKDFNFTVQANGEGKVYVAIGVQGTSEGQRHYFLDNVAVTFNRDTSP
jgi:hypothetical protein